MSPELSVVDKSDEVEFFNMEQPYLKMLISRDTNVKPGDNPLMAADKFADFQAGHFSTSDPEIIAALNTAKYRSKGVRCKSNMEDLAEFGSVDDKKTYMEYEIERRVQERLEEERVHAGHLVADGALTPDAVAESVPPEE